MLNNTLQSHIESITSLMAAKSVQETSFLNIPIQYKNGVAVMSSVDLAKLCVGDAKNAHSHFLAKAKKVLGEDVKKFHGTYLSKQGKELGNLLLPEREAMLMIGSYSSVVGRVPTGALEKAALDTIEQLLNIKLIRQYSVCGYRIDGYHEETNTAYEIDEAQHFVNGELKQECIERQKRIEKILGCTFVRVKV